MFIPIIILNPNVVTKHSIKKFSQLDTDIFF